MKCSSCSTRKPPAAFAPGESTRAHVYAGSWLTIGIVLIIGRVTCMECIPKKRKMNAERRKNDTNTLKRKNSELEAKVAIAKRSHNETAWRYVTVCVCLKL